MSFWRKAPKTTVLAQHTTRLPYFTGEHLFFEVEGSTGSLNMELTRYR